MSKGRILVADGEPETVRSIDIRLKAHGYDVIAAGDGLTAVMLAIEKKPDIIIMDIDFPACGGHTVVQCLRRHPNTSLIPIIILTARAARSDFKEAMAQGVEKYITKPFDPEELFAAVTGLILSRT